VDTKFSTTFMLPRHQKKYSVSTIMPEPSRSLGQASKLCTYVQQTQHGHPLVADSSSLNCALH